MRLGRKKTRKQLTQDAESVVHCNDDNLAVADENAWVVGVPRPVFVGFAVHEDCNWEQAFALWKVQGECFRTKKMNKGDNAGCVTRADWKLNYR